MENRNASEKWEKPGTEKTRDNETQESHLTATSSEASRTVARRHEWTQDDRGDVGKVPMDTHIFIETG